MLTSLVAVVLLAVAALPVRAAEPPQRIVSIHLCGDQLALALADPEQIVSLSRFARDPKRSYMADSVGDIPLNSGLAEEVIGYRPDLVVAGAFSSRPTVHALRELGYRVLDLALPGTLDGIREQTMRAARAFGHPERGRTLLALMDARLESARTGASASPPLAVVWQPHGFASGPGSLEHEVLVAAGFRNLAEALGLGALGHVPLERIVLARPALIVNWMGDEAAPSLARELYAHPALRSAGAPRMVAMPQRYWACPGWFVAEAVDFLAAVRRGLDGRDAP